MLGNDHACYGEQKPPHSQPCGSSPCRWLIGAGLLFAASRDRTSVGNGPDGIEPLFPRGREACLGGLTTNLSALSREAGATGYTTTALHTYLMVGGPPSDSAQNTTAIAYRLSSFDPNPNTVPVDRQIRPAGRYPVPNCLD